MLWKQALTNNEGIYQDAFNILSAIYEVDLTTFSR